ncbi:MAG: sensor histidine kinase [Chitinophagaceae bacterium]
MEKEKINTLTIPTKPLANTEKLNDIGFRLILIPFFGIAIPIITRMIDHNLFTNFQVKCSYGYTILIAFCVWEGNRYLLFTLRSYFNWFNKPIKKILALLLAISFYTIPLSTLLLVGWYHIFKNGLVDWNIVFTSTLIIMICVVFIVHVYETVFLVMDSESKMLKNEQLERARAEASLEALKNQIDPHFIFNSLNTLSHLIEESPTKAKLFNDNLADVYRYILHNKGSGLVLLKDELDFLQDYFSLLKIRFENAVRLTIEVPERFVDLFLIPPISLQLLAENAIKHNEFSDIMPLNINISIVDDELIVRNQINRKKLRKKSSNIGLRNLSERYQLTTSKQITIKNTENEFIVSLPVLKII